LLVVNLSRLLFRPARYILQPRTMKNLLTKLQTSTTSRLAGLAQQKRNLSIHEYLSADLLRKVYPFLSIWE